MPTDITILFEERLKLKSLSLDVQTAFWTSFTKYLERFAPQKPL